MTKRKKKAAPSAQRSGDVSRYGYIFCQLCRAVINALEAKPGEVEDPLGSDARYSAWFCEACDLESKQQQDRRVLNGHDPATL